MLSPKNAPPIATPTHGAASPEPRRGSRRPDRRRATARRATAPAPRARRSRRSPQCRQAGRRPAVRPDSPIASRSHTSRQCPARTAQRRRRVGFAVLERGPRPEPLLRALPRPPPLPPPLPPPPLPPPAGATVRVPAALVRYSTTSGTCGSVRPAPFSFMRVTVAVHASLSATLFLTRSSVWHEAQTVFTRFVATASGPAGPAGPAGP